jgi:CDP-diacylglycerol---serine O-phosphatidyltransferase
MDLPVPRRRLDERGPRRMRKGMYILPSLFTTGNMAAGFYAILEVVHASAANFTHLDNAAKAIGFAVLFDGLDGRVARMTGTSSDFGKEFDSLADVVTFGVAPAMLAWTWGFHLMPPVALTEWNIKLTQLGAIAAFLFLMAGGSQLARFNTTTNPQPSSGKKVFRRHADSRRGRGDCGCGALSVRSSPRILVYGDHLAGDGGRSGLPDGQHMALLQL